MTVIVKVENIENIERDLLRLAKGNIRVADDALMSIVLRADRYAKEHARDKSRPPVPDTRRYLNSISFVINKRFLGNMDAAIVSNDEKAPWFEEGTKPHVIRPKNKKALFWKGAAHPVRIVHHPGTPAYKVLGGAVEKALQFLGEEVEKSQERILTQRILD